MAKKRKKTRKQSSKSSSALSEVNYIKKAARKLKVLECLALPGWEDSGITQVVVARQKPSGAILAGVYVVDIFCLGIKNTMYRIFEFEEDYRDFLKLIITNGDEMIEVEPQFAFNLIYGAREYAEDIGFDPHPDFKLTEYILPDVEEVEYMDIEFGKDGKPLYISGPFDDVEKIMNRLSKNVGTGNFHYISQVEENPFEAIKENDFDLNQFLPIETVNAKSEKMSELNQMTYRAQVFIAGGMLQKFKGDFTALIDEPIFFEEMIENVIYNAEQSGIFGKIQGTELEEFMERNTVFVLEKMMEYQSVDFLITEDFVPVPKIITKEEYEKMSVAENRIYSEKVKNTMTRSEKTQLLFEDTFFDFFERDFEAGIKVPVTFEEANDYFDAKWEILKKDVFSEKVFDELEKDLIREYFDDTLEHFWEEKDSGE